MYRTFGTQPGNNGELNMSRLSLIDKNSSCEEVQTGFDKAGKAFGTVPNFARVLANSPIALNAVIDLWSALYSGTLSPELRTKIALSVGQENGCNYCVSAQTAIGKSIGLSETEIEAAREGKSADTKDDTAVKFAQSVLLNRGDVTDGELDRIRKAGFDDGQIVEIVVLVGLFSIGNFVGNVSHVEIDFPKVKAMANAK